MESKPARRRSEQARTLLRTAQTDIEGDASNRRASSRGRQRRGGTAPDGGEARGVHPWRLGARSEARQFGRRRAHAGSVEPTKANPEAREKKSPNPPIDAKAPALVAATAPVFPIRFIEFFTVRKFCHISLEVPHGHALPSGSYKTRQA